MTKEDLLASVLHIFIYSVRNLIQGSVGITQHTLYSPLAGILLIKKRMGNFIAPESVERDL